MPRLWCGNIAYDATQPELEELFAQYGKLTRVNFREGFAFIDYELDQDSIRAQKELDRSEFKGRRLQVQVARSEGPRPMNDESRNGDERAGPSRHLYVAHIPENVNDGELHDYFGRFGQVLSIKLLPQRGEFRSAFVDFSEPSSAEAAIKCTEPLHGAVLRMDFNYRKPRPDPRAGPPPGYDRRDNYRERSYHDEDRAGYDRGGEYPRGYDRYAGYDRYGGGGYDRGGYPPRGGGYDRGGYDRGGYDRSGYDRGDPYDYERRGDAYPARRDDMANARGPGDYSDRAAYGRRPGDDRDYRPSPYDNGDQMRQPMYDNRAAERYNGYARQDKRGPPPPGADPYAGYDRDAARGPGGYGPGPALDGPPPRDAPRDMPGAPPQAGGYDARGGPGPVDDRYAYDRGRGYERGGPEGDRYEHYPPEGDGRPRSQEAPTSGDREAAYRDYQ